MRMCGSIGPYALYVPMFSRIGSGVTISGYATVDQLSDHLWGSHYEYTVLSVYMVLTECTVLISGLKADEGF